ncbi:MAG TPA: inositol monophosphatase family protein [Egibacteraceae bacterium]|nr:inositol monophosphatase family protein [Egibacteraceae bacterium]
MSQAASGPAEPEPGADAGSPRELDPPPGWLDRAHELALGLADLADDMALSRFGSSVPAETKPDGSPVTEVDRMVESALRQRIAAVFPEHAFLGEETGGTLDHNRPTWVIDPIDGTKNFMRGVPVFACLIGVVWHGHGVLGVASAPAMGERWDAAHGRGARRNGQPVHVSAVRRLADASVLHGALEWYRDPALWRVLEHLADHAWTTRGFGDFWMHLLVAGGMADAAFETGLKPWDIAALQAIVCEAGGSLTAFDGGDALAGADGAVLTTNGLLHAELSALLAAG